MTIRSMTGFGSGEAPLGEGHLHVELRSLNHRFLDVRVRLPGELAEYAFDVEQAARAQLHRGRFDLSVRTSGPALPPPSISMPRARAIFADLCRLRDELAPDTQLSVGLLAQIPAVFTPVDDRVEQEVKRALGLALTKAIRELESMRQVEGTNLAVELRSLIRDGKSLLEGCTERARLTVESFRERIRERADRLCRDTKVAVDPIRLEQEIALLAERSDVTEELARLGSHFHQFTELLENTPPIGRRLDFLLQEVARETNTLGAKSQDTELSHLVVELKAVCERMREQVQNVE